MYARFNWAYEAKGTAGFVEYGSNTKKPTVVDAAKPPPSIGPRTPSTAYMTPRMYPGEGLGSRSPHVPSPLRAKSRGKMRAMSTENATRPSGISSRHKSQDSPSSVKGSRAHSDYGREILELQTQLDEVRKMIRALSDGHEKQGMQDRGPSKEWVDLVLQSDQVLGKLDSLAQQAGDSIRGYLKGYDEHLRTTTSEHLDTLQRKLEGNLELWNRGMEQRRDFEEQLLKEYSRGLGWYQQEIQQLQGENSNKESALEQLRVEAVVEKQRLSDEYSRLTEKQQRRQARLANWHIRQMEKKDEKWQELLTSAQQEKLKYVREVQEADEQVRSLAADLARLKEEFENVEEAKANSQQEAQEANEQIRHLDSDLVRLKAELDVAKELAFRSQQETRQANDNILDLITNLAKLKGELAAAKSSSAKSQQNLQQADEQIRRLTLDVTRLDAELKTAKQSSARNELETRQANDQVLNLTSDLARLKRELDAANQQLDSRNQQATQADEQIRRLTSNLVALKDELDLARRNLETRHLEGEPEADKRIIDLTADLVKLKSELDVARQELSAMNQQETQQAELAEARIQKLVSDLAQVQDKLKAESEAKEELEAMSRKTAQQADEQIRRLLSELINVKDELAVTRKLKQDLETSNEASVSNWQSTKEDMEKEFQAIRQDLIRLESKNEDQVKSLEEDRKYREGVEAQAARAEGDIKRLEEQILEWKKSSEKAQQEVRDLKATHRKELENLKGDFAKEKKSTEAEHQRQILSKEDKLTRIEKALEDCREARQEQAEQNAKVVQDTVRYWTQEINRVNIEYAKEKDEMHTLIREAEVALVSKEAQIEKLQEHHEAALKKIQDLTTEAAEAKTAQRSASEAQETVVELRRTLAGTKNDMDMLTKQVAQLQSEGSDAAKKNKSLEDDLQRMTENNKSLDEIVQGAVARSRSLEDEVQDLRQKNKSLEGDIQSLNGDIQSAAKTNKSLESDLETITKKNKSLEDGIQSTAAKIKSLEESLESARSELRAKEASKPPISVEDTEETKQRIVSLQKETEQMQRQLEKSKLQIQERDTQLADLDTALKQERDRSQELDKKLETSRASHQTKMAELSARLEQTTKKRDELQNLHDTRDERHEQLVNDLKTTNASLEAKIEPLKTKIDTLKYALGVEERIRTEFENSNNQRIAEFNQASAENAELKEKLARNLKAWRDFDALMNTRLAEQMRSVEKKTHEIEALEGALAEQETIKQTMREEFKEALLREEEKRNYLFGEFQKLRKDVRVMCRIRPMTGREGALVAYETSDGKFHNKAAGLELITTRGKFGTSEMVEDRTRHYVFDRLFEPHEHNGDVWKEIGQFVQSFVEGRKVTVFCYGQTATGKTYTMSNTEQQQIVDNAGNRVRTTTTTKTTTTTTAANKNEGIIPNTRDLLFEALRRRRERGHAVRARGCCYEVYLKEIRLLLPNGQVKTKTLDPSGPPWWHVRDPEYRDLEHEDDFDDMVAGAMESRTFAATTSNSNSSRSHFILYIEFETQGPTMMKPSEGSLCLVDLAGSEDPHKAARINDPDPSSSGSSNTKINSKRPGQRDDDAVNKKNTRLKEGIAINQSLRVLRNSISKIRNPGPSGKPTIEGGNEESSTLAKLLGPCLGRDSMVLMFVMINLAADSLSETKASLESAREIAEIKILGPRRIAEMAEEEGWPDQSQGQGRVTPTGPRRTNIGGRGSGIPRFGR